VTTPPPDDARTGTISCVAEPPSAAPAERPGWRRETTVFLTSQTISLFGSILVQCAIMWHLTLTTKSGSVMALAVVFGFLPQAVVSFFGGLRYATSHAFVRWLLALYAVVFVDTNGTQNCS